MPEDRTDPELPGETLHTFGLQEGTCFYDPENSNAWIAGETVPLGSASDE